MSFDFAGMNIPVTKKSPLLHTPLIAWAGGQV